MLNLILFGPPGSGKGTQAVRIAEKLGLVHISTGDLFRAEMGADSPLGLEAKAYIAKGELVPDSITIGMLKNKVNAHPEAAGFIFDGFPRTLAQAEALDAFLDESGQCIDGLLSLEVPEDEIVQRILLRGQTSGRADDLDESIIRNRFEVYQNETAPVYEHYHDQGVASKVHGLGTIDEIFDRLIAAIEALQG